MPRTTLTLGLVALALVLPPGAQARGYEDRIGSRVVDINGQPISLFQRWVARAKVPTPIQTVIVNRGPRPESCTYACASLHEDTLFVSRHINEWSFLHELGHLFDGHQPAWVRWQFLDIMGYEPSWWQGESPAGERFADAYAECGRGVHSYDTIPTVYGYAPSRRQHQAVCWLIRSR